jgi:hypothetical protein
MKVDIRISEELSKIITVDAEDVSEAINIVKKMYDDKEIVLDDSDYDGNTVFEEA